MAAAPSLYWRDVRALLSREVACALSWETHQGEIDHERASWGEQSQRNDDETARLSVVSDRDYAEPTEILTAEFLPVENTVKRASVQFAFESSEGERAQDNAESVRLWISRAKIKRALHDAGISILRVPSPTRKTPFLFQGEWVDACSFDLEIGFQTTIRETEAVTETLSVNYSGELDEAAILVGPNTVVKP